MKIEELLALPKIAAGKIKRINDHEFDIQCPVHTDTEPSLHVTVKPDGKILLYCFGAECSFDAICNAFNIRPSELFGDDDWKKVGVRSRSGLTLDTLAAAKKLPIDFLKSLGIYQRFAEKHDKEKNCVSTWTEIVAPYYHEDGSRAPRSRRRFALSGDRKFAWLGSREDGEILPYGLQRLSEARKLGYLVVVEGESDSWTLWHHDFPALGIPGVSLVGKCLKANHVKGINRIYVIQEHGPSGEQFVANVARRLSKLRKWEGQVYPVKLEADDPSDLHCQDPAKFEERFQAAIDAAEPVDLKAAKSDRADVASSGKPEIVLNSFQLDVLTGQAVKALLSANDPPVVFVRGGQPCRVARDEHGRARIGAVNKAKLRHRLAECAEFKIVSEERVKIVGPPDHVTESILALPEYPFPALTGISTIPILRPDGSICQTPGYDRATATYYILDPDLKIPPIPEQPTREEVEAAVEAVLDPFADFPFDSSASRANALALLLSLAMRPAIQSNVPLALIDAPVQGTGKTLLVQAEAGIAVGPIAVQTAPSRRDDDEMRKRLTATLIDGSPAGLLDNFPENAVLESPALAAVMTSAEWTDRRLGVSENVRVPARTVWIVTGNNIRVGGDIPRRSYTIRLDSNVERPWQRSGFRHPDILGYVRENRGRLLAAVFTMIRSWYQAGKPKSSSVPAFGSFEEWAQTIGGVLAHAGIDGFLGNLDELRAVQDEEGSQWRAFFGVWWDHLQEQPTTVADLATITFGPGSEFSTPTYLPDALLAARDKGEGSLRRTLGKNLSRLAGRIFEGHKLQAAGQDGHTKSRRWRLVEVEPCGVSGDCGVSGGQPVRDARPRAHAARTEAAEGNPANAANPAAGNPPSLHDREAESQGSVPACVQEQGHVDVWRVKPGGVWKCAACEPPGTQFCETQLEQGRWDLEFGQIVVAEATADATA